MIRRPSEVLHTPSIFQLKSAETPAVSLLCQKIVQILVTNSQTLSFKRLVCGLTVVSNQLIIFQECFCLAFKYLALFLAENKHKDLHSFSTVCTKTENKRLFHDIFVFYYKLHNLHHKI